MSSRDTAEFTCYICGKTGTYQLRHPQPKRHRVCPNAPLQRMFICEICGKPGEVYPFYIRKHGMPSKHRTCALRTEIERKELKKLTDKKYSLENADKVTARGSVWYKNNREKQKFSIMKRLYGLSFEAYTALLNKQDNRCAICKDLTDLCIDHDHKTGRVRGLLCKPCNTGLGAFRDTIEFLQTSIEYLNINSDSLT